MGVNAPDNHGFCWTCSGGGPVLAIPAESAGAWRGTLPPIGAAVPEGWTWGKSGGPVCDYDNACDPGECLRTEYGGLGWVHLANNERALALDGEIYTQWLPEGESAGTIRRGNPEGKDAGPGPESFKPFGEISLRDGRLFLFDSAFNGHEDPEQIGAHDGVAVAQLSPGRYAISIATDGAGTDFVRFRKIN